MKTPSLVKGKSAKAGRQDAAADNTTSKPRRRNQEQRRADTKKKLCAAAVDLLTEVGYERLTVAQIAQRAGVSKGAQAHHYPSKDDMLVAAYQHLLSQWEERRLAFVRQHGQAVGMDQLMHYMWNDVFGRPDFLASIEMMLAARHHPELQKRLQEVLASWTEARDQVLRSVVPLSEPADLAAFLQISFCFLRGLALYNGLSRDPTLNDRMLSMWVDMANGFLERKPSTRQTTRPISNNRSKQPVS